MDVDSLEKLIVSELASVRRELALTTRASERALEAAGQEAKDRLAAHNGLIEQGRERDAQYATREQVEAWREHTSDDLARLERTTARITGALVLLSFALPIAVAVLVKVIP
jgi:hypothetical protein